MRIETIRIKNFKGFRDAEMTDIPAFCVIIGANGSGKSTLFDIFGFLRDCLTFNVSRALSARGGFKEVLSRGADITKDAIILEIQFRTIINNINRLVTYEIHIGQKDNKPIIRKENLRYKRGRYGNPYHFLSFQDGEGYAIINEEDFKTDEQLKREYQTVDPDVLAIKGLGQFARFKAASTFRQIIENWHISDFKIDLARGSKDAAGEFEHLSVSGNNLQLVARHIYETNPNLFKKIVDAMKHRVPGVGDIKTMLSEDGRLLLAFQDKSFKDPFIDRYVSDGTIKMLAYLLLLYDPNPHPLLCVEEPENQLYHTLLWELAEEFRAYANRGGQVFVSSHSPDFLNAAQIHEVFWLIKKDGYTSIGRAKDDKQLAAFINEGDQMGYLWKQGLFEQVGP